MQGPGAEWVGWQAGGRQAGDEQSRHHRPLVLRWAGAVLGAAGSGAKWSVSDQRNYTVTLLHLQYTTLTTTAPLAHTRLLRPLLLLVARVVANTHRD